jgi:hypothetical protein
VGVFQALEKRSACFPGIAWPEPSPCGEGKVFNGRFPMIGKESTGPVSAGLFLVSAVALGWQLALMRVLSIGQWHHFAYLVISLAVLGFGAGGTVCALIREWVRGAERAAFGRAVFLFSAALPVVYGLSQQIPFETFELVTQPRQWLRLMLLYVVLATPFLIASVCVGLGFLIQPDRIGRVYAANLLGSGVGALAGAGLMYIVPPERLTVVWTVVSWVAWVVASRAERRLGWGGWAIRLAALAACALFALQPIRVSAYKGLSYALQYPDARVEARAFSPLSQITAVSSARIRETPGQISGYPYRERGPLPEQIALFFDGGAASVINRFEGDLEKMAWLEYVTAALPYTLLDRPEALVAGAGGGTDVLMALRHGARRVTAVDLDPRVFDLMRGRFGAFSGGLYDRPDVALAAADARDFLRGTTNRYDLIQLALVDSFSASAAGVHALSESFLYTVEAVAGYADRLTPGGFLAITRWLESPPRDAVKMFATLAEGWERAGHREPARHLAFIRSWNTGTLLAGRAPLTPEQIQSIRRFCEERSFDLCYLPGLERGEANRFILLDQPVYFDAATALLSPRRAAFYRYYLFHVQPATDDRPYFFRFFKWSSAPRLIRGMGADWIPYMEWGYVALIAALVQAIPVSVLLIVFPLWWSRRFRSSGGSGGGALPYFALIGLAYMALELAFIQRFMLFLAYPVYAVAVIVTSFLVFSGLGSRLADRHRAHPRALLLGAVTAIGIGVALSFWLLSALYSKGIGWPRELRAAVSLVALAPLAVAMGIPFPTGLQALSSRTPAWVPWAWAVNGCASVLGALLATLGSMHLGFRVMMGLAVALYAAAGWIGLRTFGGPCVTNTNR